MPDKDTGAVLENDQQEANEGVETNIEFEDECKCNISVNFDGDYLKTEFEKQLENYRQEMQLPGFRKGKAPKELLKRKYESALKVDVLSNLLSETYDSTVTEHNLNVVNYIERPDPEKIEWEVGEPVTANFKCEVLPDVEIEEDAYKGIKLDVPRDEVPEDVMDSQIKSFLSRYASWEEVENGTVDLEDFVECEVSLAEGKPEDWSTKAAFTPQQEEIGPLTTNGIKGAATGAKPGDTIEVDARLEGEAEDLPAEYRQLGENGDTEFKLQLKINKIYRRDVPELNDEFARNMGLADADELRSYIKERTQRQMQQQRRRIIEDVLTDALVDNIDITIPESMIEGFSESVRNEWIVNAIRQGIPVEEARQMGPESVEESRQIAERNLKANYILREIGEKERVYVLDSEVKDQIRAQAAQQGWTEEKMQKYLEKNDMINDMRWSLRREKIVQRLLDLAEVNEVDWDKFEDKNK
jgi:trigger factor